MNIQGMDDEKPKFMQVHIENLQIILGNTAENKSIGGLEFKLLLSIASTLNYRSGLSTATNKKLAGLSGYTVPTVKLGLSKLKAAKLLAIVKTGRTENALLPIPQVFMIGSKRCRALAKIRFAEYADSIAAMEDDE